MRKSIYDELESNRQIVAGALASPEIIRLLSPLGYDRKEINFGNGLLTKFANQQDEREHEENLQKESTQKLHEAYKAVNTRYMGHLKLARMLFTPQSQAWNDMKLGGKRSQNMTGWLVQVKAFYKYAIPLADTFAQRGITAEELAQTEAMIEAVAEARIQQNQSKSRKQVAKERRDRERKEMQQWMSKFIKAARYAFDEDKQQLEALGIVVPS
ncbi:hypothetical protein WJR50_08995 [Catalinimonas sp. 4WD22]|uniref:hypothetical protein n=1 Tax=Catalinimonas locisalis TaxID=3133978 RepID=UPI0031019A7A